RTQLEAGIAELAAVNGEPCGYGWGADSRGYRPRRQDSERGGTSRTWRIWRNPQRRPEGAAEGDRVASQFPEERRRLERMRG
ncbi:unnamed protein product, partial [Ectocarpus fasciculatus]